MEQAKPNPFIQTFDKAVSILSFIGSIWIIILMFIIFSDVVSRGFFSQPIAGIPEVVKNSIVGLTFLQLTHVLREGRHIRTTLLLDRVSPLWKNILLAFGNILGVLIFAVIFLVTLDPAIKAFHSGEFEGSFVRIPTFPTYFLILLGSLLMTIQYGLLFFRNLFFYRIRGNHFKSQRKEMM